MKRKKAELSQHEAAPPKKSPKQRCWETLQGWKAVDIGDEFLLGAEDGGFAGLEELDGAVFLQGSSYGVHACGYPPQQQLHVMCVYAFCQASSSTATAHWLSSFC